MKPRKIFQNPAINLAIVSSIAVSVTLVAAPSTAQASCNDLTTLKTQVEADFQSLKTPGNLIQELQVFAQAHSCVTAKQLAGPTELVCYWQYDYRSKAALNQFTKLNQDLQNCGDQANAGVKDQDVNHPDFYDLRTYKDNGASFSVSLKDKAALDQTLVFFRVSKSP